MLTGRTYNMQKNVYRLLLFCCLSGMASTAFAADLYVESTTMMRFFQDSRYGYTDKTYAPATQFLNVDLEKLADGNLSLHLSGWGRADLADKSFGDKRHDHTNGYLTYGYLQYDCPKHDARLRAGRLFVMEGIINEQVDGASLRTALPYGFGLSVFGGATVHNADLYHEKTDGKGDAIYGGRVNYNYDNIVEVGFSGVYETNVPHLVSTGNRTLVADGKYGSRRLIGADIWLSPFEQLEVMGQSSYNTETSEFAEHNYRLNLRPMDKLTLSGEFSEYRDNSYFLSSVMFSRMYQGLNDKSRIYGASAYYSLTPQLDLTADYRHYKREIGNADRFGADISYRFDANKIRTGAAYHYLRAGSGFAVIPESNASASFHELRGYVMRDAKKYIASADAIAYVYKKKISGKRSAWEAICSLGYKFTPDLILSGDMSYGQSPEYKDDLKGLLRLSYNFSFSNILGGNR